MNRLRIFFDLSAYAIFFMAGIGLCMLSRRVEHAEQWSLLNSNVTFIKLDTGLVVTNTGPLIITIPDFNKVIWHTNKP